MPSCWNEDKPEEEPFYSRNCRCELIPFVENAYYFLPDFIEDFLDKILEDKTALENDDAKN